MGFKVAFISLGCAKNLVNTEQMMALVRKAGHTVVPEPAGADAVVVNTCGFIETAKTEAIDNILEMARLKEGRRLRKIIVAGCLSQRHRQLRPDRPRAGKRDDGRLPGAVRRHRPHL